MTNDKSNRPPESFKKFRGNLIFPLLMVFYKNNPRFNNYLQEIFKNEEVNESFQKFAKAINLDYPKYREEKIEFEKEITKSRDELLIVLEKFNFLQPFNFFVEEFNSWTISGENSTVSFEFFLNSKENKILPDYIVENLIQNLRINLLIPFITLYDRFEYILDLKIVKYIHGQKPFTRTFSNLFLPLPLFFLLAYSYFSIREGDNLENKIQIDKKINYFEPNIFQNIGIEFNNSIEFLHQSLKNQTQKSFLVETSINESTFVPLVTEWQMLFTKEIQPQNKLISETEDFMKDTVYGFHKHSKYRYESDYLWTNLLPVTENLLNNFNFDELDDIVLRSFQTDDSYEFINQGFTRSPKEQPLPAIHPKYSYFAPTVQQKNLLDFAEALNLEETNIPEIIGKFNTSSKEFQSNEIKIETETPSNGKTVESNDLFNILDFVQTNDINSRLTNTKFSLISDNSNEFRSSQDFDPDEISLESIIQKDEIMRSKKYKDLNLARASLKAEMKTGYEKIPPLITPEIPIYDASTNEPIKQHTITGPKARSENNFSIDFLVEKKLFSIPAFKPLLTDLVQNDKKTQNSIILESTEELEKLTPTLSSFPHSFKKNFFLFHEEDVTLYLNLKTNELHSDKNCDPETNEEILLGRKIYLTPELVNKLPINPYQSLHSILYTALLNDDLITEQPINEFRYVETLLQHNKLENIWLGQIEQKQNELNSNNPLFLQREFEEELAEELEEESDKELSDEQFFEKNEIKAKKTRLDEEEQNLQDKIIAESLGKPEPIDLITKNKIEFELESDLNRIDFANASQASIDRYQNRLRATFLQIKQNLTPQANGLEHATLVEAPSIPVYYNCPNDLPRPAEQETYLASTFDWPLRPRLSPQLKWLFEESVVDSINFQLMSSDILFEKSVFSFEKGTLSSFLEKYKYSLDSEYKHKENEPVQLSFDPIHIPLLLDLSKISSKENIWTDSNLPLQPSDYFPPLHQTEFPFFFQNLTKQGYVLIPTGDSLKTEFLSKETDLKKTLSQDTVNRFFLGSSNKNPHSETLFFGSYKTTDKKHFLVQLTDERLKDQNLKNKIDQSKKYLKKEIVEGFRSSLDNIFWIIETQNRKKENIKQTKLNKKRLFDDQVPMAHRVDTIVAADEETKPLSNGLKEAFALERKYMYEADVADVPIYYNKIDVSTWKPKRIKDTDSVWPKLFGYKHAETRTQEDIDSAKTAGIDLGIAPSTESLKIIDDFDNSLLKKRKKYFNAQTLDELQKEFVHYPADLNELPLLIETHLTEIYAKRDYEGYVKYDLKNPGEITFDEWNFWKDVLEYDSKPHLNNYLNKLYLFYSDQRVKNNDVEVQVEDKVYSVERGALRNYNSFSLRQFHRVTIPVPIIGFYLFRAVCKLALPLQRLIMAIIYWIRRQESAPLSVGSLSYNITFVLPNEIFSNINSFYGNGVNLYTILGSFSSFKALVFARAQMKVVSLGIFAFSHGLRQSPLFFSYSWVLDSLMVIAISGFLFSYLPERTGLIPYSEAISRMLQSLKTFSRSKQLDLSGFTEKGTYAIHSGYLLYGHPGCGKSLFFEALVQYLGAIGVRLDVCAPRDLTQVLKNAKLMTPVILFLDNLNRLGKPRDEKLNPAAISTRKILNKNLIFSTPEGHPYKWSHSFFIQDHSEIVFKQDIFIKTLRKFKFSSRHIYEEKKLELPVFQAFEELKNGNSNSLAEQTLFSKLIIRTSTKKNKLYREPYFPMNFLQADNKKCFLQIRQKFMTRLYRQTNRIRVSETIRKRDKPLILELKEMTRSFDTIDAKVWDSISESFFSLQKPYENSRLTMSWKTIKKQRRPQLTENKHATYETIVSHNINLTPFVQNYTKSNFSKNLIRRSFGKLKNVLIKKKPAKIYVEANPLDENQPRAGLWRNMFERDGLFRWKNAAAIAELVSPFDSFEDGLKVQYEYFLRNREFLSDLLLERDYKIAKQQEDILAQQSLELFLKKQKKQKNLKTLLTLLVLLQDVPDSTVLIGTVWNKNDLDPALLRAGRFDRLIRFDFPSYQSRLGLLKLSAGKHPFSTFIPFPYQYSKSYQLFGCLTENFTMAELVEIFDQAHALTFLVKYCSQSLNDCRLNPDDPESPLNPIKYQFFCVQQELKHQMTVVYKEAQERSNFSYLTRNIFENYVTDGMLYPVIMRRLAVRRLMRAKQFFDIPEEMESKSQF